MEHPSSSKEKGMGRWDTSRGQLESFMPLDGGMGDLSFEDVYGNFANLPTLDATAGWCYSSAVDPIFPSGLSLVPSMPCTSLDPSNFVEDNSEAFSMNEISGVTNSMGSSFNCGDKGLFHQLESVFRFAIDSSDVNESESKQNNVMDTGSYIISRPFGWSLDERMLRALALFKESSGEGILAQVWVPVKHGNQYVLTTSEQPYLLDQMLTGFREVSRMFTFSTEEKPGAVLGLPGRVFASKIPEWTSNVSYYKKGEYLRVEHALGHDVRGSIALPVFDFQSEMSCCAVLELVTNKEKPNFDMEMEVVCQALQAVNLRTTPPPRLLPHSLTNNQKSALAEITDVLRAVCHAHRLPLALAWIPCCYTTGADDGSTRVHVRDSTIGPHEKCIICIEESACYVNDKTMQDFLDVCTNHYLEEGQGIVGKALQSNHPFFNPDVQAYDINEYPLVHHVRKFGLNAAVAIRLRSTYTGVDDYILELFLPVNMTGSTEQQLLLNSLSGTMQRICRSLRTVSNVDFVCSEHPKVGFQDEAVQKFTPISFRITKSRTSDTLSAKEKLKLSKSANDEVETSCPSDLTTSGSKRLLEKKRSTAEKNVSLSVLQQYFSGSLKDAAKNIGVCPTTLKRICRQHGISRWPSRKINKVNRSLRKIQTVLDSVQGVEGGLKFDPSTGGFIAAGTPMEEFNRQSSFLLPEKKPCCGEAPAFNNPVSVPRACFNGRSSSIKLEDDEFLMAGDDIIPSISIPERTSDILPVDLSGDSKSSSSLAADEMDTGGEADDGVVEHNHPLSSSTGDSSSGSRTLLHGSSSGSQSLDDQKYPKDKISCDDSGSKITIKASYGEEIIRFKFDPSWGYLQLNEEVAKRFKLPSGSFELKYLDDEKEWVMLAYDSDLQECLELMEDFGARTVKFLVRDRPFAVSSSTGSCCFLSGD